MISTDGFPYVIRRFARIAANRCFSGFSHNAGVRRGEVLSALRRFERWYIRSCRPVVVFGATVTRLFSSTSTRMASLIHDPHNAETGGMGHSSGSRKIIVDCDAGVDDAMALIVALDQVRRGKVDLLAVTCTHGNSSADNVAVNVLRVLDAMKFPKIPVFKGAKIPLLQPYVFDSALFHGSDGFGDAEFDQKPDLNRISGEHASLAMIRLASQYPGDVTLVTTGPLTNVALAMKIDDGFVGKLKDLFVMGGNLQGRGNVTTCAEFNFHCDPESAVIVLDGSEKAPILITLDLCLKQGSFPMEWRRGVLGTMKSPQTELQNKIEHKCLEVFDRNYDSYAMFDQLAVAAAVNPDLVLGTTNLHATVELGGNYARGMMVVEARRRVRGKRDTVVVVDEIDRPAFESMVLDAFRE